MTEIDVTWRGDFIDTEANRLHAAAFDTRIYQDTEWPWTRLTAEHSLGWVTATAVDGAGHAGLIGFLNVLWDGLAHAWLQDVMVDPGFQGRGVGVAMVQLARDRAAEAGCEWLHVDFDDDLSPFYIDACGFQPSAAGIMRLDGDS